VIEIGPATEDAPEFVAYVRRLADGLCRLARPRELYVVQVTNWFDRKWLRFSGKTLGALGVWNRELTLPPFHPHRIKRQLLFRADPLIDASIYWRVPAGRKLHVAQHSGANLQRRMELVAPKAGCLWYSGKSDTTGRGAVMAYLPGQPEYSAWYVSLQRRAPDWRLSVIEGISRAELAQLVEPA
jgi:hypothetical protein